MINGQKEGIEVKKGDLLFNLGTVTLQLCEFEESNLDKAIQGP